MIKQYARYLMIGTRSFELPSKAFFMRPVTFAKVKGVEVPPGLKNVEWVRIGQ